MKCVEPLDAVPRPALRPLRSLEWTVATCQPWTSSPTVSRHSGVTSYTLGVYSGSTVGLQCTHCEAPLHIPVWPPLLSRCQGHSPHFASPVWSTHGTRLVAALCLCLPAYYCSVHLGQGECTVGLHFTRVWTAPGVALSLLLLLHVWKKSV